MASISTFPPEFMTMPETAKWARISLAFLYTERKSGKLRTIKVGARTLVSIHDARAWMASYGAPTGEAATGADDMAAIKQNHVEANAAAREVARGRGYALHPRLVPK